MGYDLHITKKDNWFDDEPQISPDEWKGIVDSDHSLKLSGKAVASTPDGSIIEYKNNLLAEWSEHPTINPVWFDFRNGNIVVKNPDGHILSKMLDISKILDAKVRGDEGEVYTLKDTHGIEIHSNASHSINLIFGIAGLIIVLIIVGAFLLNKTGG